VGPWDVGAVADGMLMIQLMKDGIDGDVPGVITESLVVIFKRLLASILVMVGSDNVDGREVILIKVLSDNVEGRIVMLLIVGSDNVDGRAVKLVIGIDIPEIDRRGAEVTGFVSMIGWPSGPTLTARLASMTTVLVPFRRVPVGGLPKPCVNVHTPSAYLKPVHVDVLEQVSEQSK
jgi:hypothetical protein